MGGLMDYNLTPRQREFISYIEDEINKNDSIPSLRKAAADLGVSHTAISHLIKKLEEKKILKRGGRYSRAIELVKDTTKQRKILKRMKEVPIIGRIAAGLPLYAQQEWDGSLFVDSDIYKGTKLFALKVTGDSMKEAAIIDGDIAICEPCQFAQNGDIIVALINHEEATVKRFFFHNSNIELSPANSTYKSKFYSFNEILIQGKVVGIHRGADICSKL